MLDKANPSPGFRDRPEHTVAVTQFDGTVTVSLGETTIASSDGALELREANYPPVFYIPFKDVHFDRLEPSDRKTYCPFKGDASYWNASAAGQSVKDVMWAYQAPYDELTGIKDYAAFYPSKVTIEATPRQE